MFNALKYPTYRLFWIGQLTSVLGQNMQFVAQAWLVWELTQSPFWIGLTSLTSTVPGIIFAFFGGAAADRMNRNMLLSVTQWIQAALYLIVTGLIFAGMINVWHIMVFSFLMGISRAYDMPARQATVPSLVPREDLANAVALGSTVWQLSRLLGPAAAGAIIATSGVGLAFLAGAIGYAIFGVLMFFIDAPAAPPRPNAGLLQEIGEGLAFIRRTDIVFTFILMTFFNSLFGMSYTTLMPVIASNVLHVGPQGFGMLESAAGFGALFGTISVAALSGHPRKGLHGIIGASTFGVLLMVFSLSESYPISLTIMALAGLANQFYMTTAMTTLQMQLPNEFRGRVMGVYGLCWSLIPLGGTINGAVAEVAGAPFAIALGGFLVAGMAVAVYAFLPQVRDIGRGTLPQHA